MMVDPDVTMVQRGSTHVQSVARGNKVILSGLYEENGPPVEIADLMGASYPNLLVARLTPRRTDIIEELDRYVVHRHFHRTDGLLLILIQTLGVVESF
jgi:hypothetical protein